MREEGGNCSYPIYQPNLCRSWNSFSSCFFKLHDLTGVIFHLFLSLSPFAKRRFLDKDKNLERISFYIYLGGFALKGAAFAAFLFTFTTIEFQVISVGHRFTCRCLLKGMERCNRLRDEIYSPPSPSFFFFKTNRSRVEACFNQA